MWLARMDADSISFDVARAGSADPAEISGGDRPPLVAAIQGHQAADIMLRMNHCVLCAQGEYPLPSQTFR